MRSQDIALQKCKKHIALNVLCSLRFWVFFRMSRRHAGCISWSTVNYESEHTVSSLARLVSDSLESQVSFRISSNIPHLVCILAPSHRAGLRLCSGQKNQSRNFVTLLDILDFVLFNPQNTLVLKKKKAE